MADEQSLPIDPFQASAAIAEAHSHDAELIALAGRMGLHSLDVEQLRMIFQSHPFNTTAVASHGGASVEVKEPQIPVTDEMIAAAVNDVGSSCLGGSYATEAFVTRVYRAMAAVAPVELVSANEDRIAVLEAENAALVTANKRLADGPPTRHPPEYVAKVLMDREGRYNDPFAHARLTEVIRCARLDGRKQARDVALEIIAANEDRIAALEAECEALSAALHAEIQMRDDHVLGLRGDLAALEAANADRAETERRLGNLLARASDERQELLDRLTEAYLERDERDIVILAKEERIAELKSELAMRVTTKPTAAQQTATDLKPTNEPKAMPANALKPAPTDRRRIGG